MVKSTRWKKMAGTAGKLIAVLPDTTEIIGRAIDNTRPIIEKELDRHHHRKNAYVDLDNIVHLDVTDAKQLLEKQGFVVREIIAYPEAKYARAIENQVISMYPRGKKAKAGALIKLYYLDQASINASSILAQEKLKKSEELAQKVANSFSGIKSPLKKKKSPKDVTPSGDQ